MDGIEVILTLAGLNNKNMFFIHLLNSEDVEEGRVTRRKKLLKSINRQMKDTS